MAGIIKYIAPVEYASGKTFGVKNSWTAVHRNNSHKPIGCAFMGKRNLVAKPYSDDEKAAKNAFKTAAKTRVQIASNDAAWNAWYSAFKTAKTAGSTKCITLNGFMQANIIKGNIAAGTLMPNIPA